MDALRPVFSTTMNATNAGLLRAHGNRWRRMPRAKRERIAAELRRYLRELQQPWTHRDAC